MSLCHLYFKNSSSQHIPKLLEFFDDSISLDFESLESIDKFDLYVVELEEIDKQISLKLKHLFKNIDNSLIYFIVPKKYNLMFFQLVFLLNSKDVITQNQDTYKLINKIKVDLELQLKNKIKKLLADVTIKTQSFIVYINNELIYISQNLLDSFECNDYDMFEHNMLSKLDLNKLLEDDKIIEKSITNKQYILESISITEIEKIIYIEEHTPEQTVVTDGLHFVSSRVSFIEMLKEKLLHREITHNQLSVITVNIQNIKSLQKDLSVDDLEDLFGNLLHYMESILENKLIFSQYDRDFYLILFENISFEEVKEIADDFHNKVINYIINQKYKPVVDVFIFDLNNLEFSEILANFDRIKTKNFTREQINSNYILYSDKTQKIVTEKDILDNAYEDGITFKVLNIYNGLVINTNAKIVKITKNTVYIRFDQLQGVVLNLEKETVIQSSVFLQDIRAEVKQIDLKKKIAILENFKFLKTNANSRKHARVTTGSKIPISISLNGITINGHILDLSIKSIAIKVIYTPKLDLIKANNIALSFNIPNSRVEEGYIQLNLGAKVIAITPKNKAGNAKVICDFDEESDNESKLMEYVYDRQKELIIKLKKMSKLN